jgi:hypothetical protein
MPTIKRRPVGRKARQRRIKSPPAVSRGGLSLIRIVTENRGSAVLRRLLVHLAADLAGLVGGRVDIDVPLAAHQIGHLRVGERGRTFE